MKFPFNGIIFAEEIYPRKLAKLDLCSVKRPQEIVFGETEAFERKYRNLYFRQLR